MKVPITWVKDFVDIDLPLEDLAHQMTMAGLEVEAIQYIGLAMPDGKAEGGSAGHLRAETKTSGLAWDPDRIVVAAILEVMPHPNADRLVLCRLDDGIQEHIVLTGAPNLFDYKGKGSLSDPIKVAYAKEGARIYDGHQPGQVPTTLKRTKIRGVESYSMVCSEKELGISDEHEGIIILDSDAPVGVPLAEYMGDAVFDVNIIPNIARDANIFGVAREIAAITQKPLRQPDASLLAQGPSIEGKAALQITNPELNPRFVLGLIEGISIQPSPYGVQRRLRLAGMRPINNIVDATNYAMLELGEPLHAFDYDVLVARAGGKAPTIITRTANTGEHLTTLDEVDRTLTEETMLVCDTAGSLSIAGVMGGLESEVTENTHNILLEGAAWNFINIRKTVATQHLDSEAAYRFSRGVHPAMADRGVRRCLELMRRWAGGLVYQGLVDSYPLPPKDPVVTVTPGDVRRWLGIQMEPRQMADILERLEFKVEVQGDQVTAHTPDHRLDIGEGVVGVADLMEEIARIYGYENIPETRLADELPPQRGNPRLTREEKLRDMLVSLGFQEVINYRMTSPEREARRLPEGVPPDDKPYVHLANPIASDRRVLRHSLLSSLLEVIERNARLRERIAIFEIGPIFFASEEGDLPDELPFLEIAITGPRSLPGWQSADTAPMDFYDLKGLLVELFDGLHIADIGFEPGSHPSYHPGKCATIKVGEQQVGVLGELHPLVKAHYDLPPTALMAAELNLQVLFAAIPDRYEVQGPPIFPPVLEDLALVVDESLPAEQVEDLIRSTGGKMITGIRLFDVYRSDQIGQAKKSLAYSITYQATDRTLTDEDVARIRQKILRRLEQELGARLRS